MQVIPHEEVDFPKFFWLCPACDITAVLRPSEVDTKDRKTMAFLFFQINQVANAKIMSHPTPPICLAASLRLWKIKSSTLEILKKSENICCAPSKFQSSFAWLQSLNTRNTSSEALPYTMHKSFWIKCLFFLSELHIVRRWAASQRNILIRWGILTRHMNFQTGAVEPDSVRRRLYPVLTVYWPLGVIFFLPIV